MESVARMLEEKREIILTICRCQLGVDEKKKDVSSEIVNFKRIQRIAKRSGRSNSPTCVSYCVLVSSTKVNTFS